MTLSLRLSLAFVLTALVPAGVVAHEAPRPRGEGPAVPGLTYELEEVAPGVFAAIAQGVPYYISNSVVVVGDDGVLLVDSGAGTSESCVLREAIRRVTDRPVRYVVDTHFHFDHALGHEAFPETVTLGHEATREGLALGREQPTLAGNLAGMPAWVARLEAEAATEKDETRSASLRGQAAALEAYRRQLAALTPSPSRITFTRGLTVWLGRREVRILHLGRGHTAGDTVVYLPRERVVCTGDLFNGYIGYMGDAYVDEWADTLGRLAELDFDTVVAGHGKPFRGKEALPAVHACLRDLWRQAEGLKKSGLSAAEAAARIDLSAHAGRFPRLATPGYEPLAVERIYAVIDERRAMAGTVDR
jgi:glyoxylase-like metal-dependent hydrolase (beta-lactamase superfamily II)